MSCCRPGSIRPGPPGNQIQNNDLPYGREIYSDRVLPPCFALRCLPPSLSRLFHVYIFSLCVSSLFICLSSSVLYSYTCRLFLSGLSEQFPRLYFFYTERLLRLMSPEGNWSSFSRKTACRDIRVQFRRRVLDFGHGHQLLGNCIVLKQ